MMAARWIYGGAGIYGLLVLFPGLFSEARFNADWPPALTHPEFYYGFYGSALVWQLLFLMIAREPARYRALMPVTILEKLAFFLPCVWLWLDGRLAMGSLFWGAMIDGVLGMLFVVAWVRTKV